MDQPHQAFAFGDFVLDVDRGTLQRDGVELALRPKSFEVLRYLVERQGRLVTKDQLLESIWGPAIVSEGALTQCVIDIRRALGEDGHRIVRTVPRRGFIFEPPVRNPAPSDRKRQGWAAVAVATVLLAAGAAWWHFSARTAPGPTNVTNLAAVATGNSIAVLPFEDLSPGQDHQYLSDGIAEEILNLLARALDLRVVARTSSFAFRGDQADVATIARRLNVRYLLEGSVRTSDDRVRVTAQLIDAASGMHLWSETFNHSLDDLFALQDDVAGKVASELQLRLRTPDRLAAGAVPSRAHMHFLQGQFFYNRRDPGDADRAQAEFKRAVAIDDRHARAWTGLAATYLLQVMAGQLELAKGIALQGEAVDRALALDPNLAEAHIRAAGHWLLRDEPAAANQHFARALELEPDNSLVLGVAAGRAAAARDFDTAIALQRRAVEIDPVHYVNSHNLGGMLMAAERYLEALAEFQRLREVQGGQEIEHSIGLLNVLLGRSDMALSVLERLEPGFERDQVQALASHELGLKADADAALRRLRERPAGANPAAAMALMSVLAHRGDTDDAFAVLSEVIKVINSQPLSMQRRSHSVQLWNQPFSRTLWQDPRWAALLDRIDRQ